MLPIFSPTWESVCAGRTHMWSVYLQSRGGLSVSADPWRSVRGQRTRPQDSITAGSLVSPWTRACRNKACGLLATPLKCWVAKYIVGREGHCQGRKERAFRVTLICPRQLSGCSFILLTKIFSPKQTTVSRRFDSNKIHTHTHTQRNTAGHSNHTHVCEST